MVWPDSWRGFEPKLPIRVSPPTGTDLPGYPQHAQLLAGNNPGEERSQHKHVGEARGAAVRAPANHAPRSRRAELPMFMTITDIFSRRA